MDPNAWIARVAFQIVAWGPCLSAQVASGRPSHEPVGEEQGAIAVRWLGGRYLEQAGSP